MKPLALNLSKVKKIGGDEKSSTFLHPDGHKIHIAHAGVSALQRKQLEKLPVQKLAEGGVSETPSPRPDEFDEMVDTLNPFKTDPAKLEQDHAQAMASLPKTPEEDTSDAGPPAPKPVVAAPVELPEAVQNLPEHGAPVGQSTTPALPVAKLGGDIQHAYDLGKTAIQEQQAVSSQQANAQEDIEEQRIEEEQALSAATQKTNQELMDQRKIIVDDYAKGHINPKHYHENMSVGDKVTQGIGLLLGGFGSAFTGQGNPAMDFLNKQIDRDIASQEANMNKQKNLLGAYQDMFHDSVAAHNLARVSMNDIYTHKIQLEAAKLGTPQAKAIADQATSQFELQNAQLVNQTALRTSVLGQMKQGGTSALDPAQLVPLLVKDPAQQMKVYGEIQAAQNTKHMGDSIKKAFEQSVMENTNMKTGFGQIRTPASVYALHQAMQPTFADLEGTVRQAAMDNTFKNITPMPGDLDHTIQTKRAALGDYLQSKSSAPVAKGNGLDLQNFASTRSAPKAPVHKVGDIVYADGNKYQITDSKGSVKQVK